jgi:hypothetical protein
LSNTDAWPRNDIEERLITVDRAEIKKALDSSFRRAWLLLSFTYAV